WYWSLMTLLGSVIDSTRSWMPKRPATPVRSGPVEPPSWLKRWQAKQLAAANMARPLLKVRVLSPLLARCSTSPVVHFLTNGRGGAITGLTTSGLASRIGLSAVCSSGVRVLTASVLMLRTKPAKLLPPLYAAALRNHLK